MGADMAALARLREAVGVGWHAYTRYYSSRDGEDRGGVITGLTDAGYTTKLYRTESSQGRGLTIGIGAWPVDGEDFEVEELTRYGEPVWVLHLYRLSYGKRVRFVSVEYTKHREKR